MSDRPLMPRATAVWLVDNTALTFKQIAEFTGLHELEIQGIADGEVAQGVRGIDPIASGQLTREEIEKGEKDPNYRLKLSKPAVELPKTRRKGPKYTPVSKRQDKPNAIAWLLKHHPELSDSQIIKLIGTTRNTIEAIRNRTHWNIAEITPKDPVTLGLCKQVELDEAVRKAAERAAKERKRLGLPEPAEQERLKTPDEMMRELDEKSVDEVFGEAPAAPQEAEEEPVPDADSVFAGLQKKSDE